MCFGQQTVGFTPSLGELLRMENDEIKVIIDTDIRVDDAQALTFMLACKNVNVIAITLVAGNGGIDVITPNAEKILSFLGIYKPIYLPGGYSLDGMKIKTDWYFGSNGFAEIELPPSHITHRTDMKSVEALLYYSKKYANELHLLCMGPLTNIALAFMVDNDFPSRLASITIIGGDRSEQTFNNASEYAEFNAWCDPRAYMILNRCILSDKVNVTLIDWTTCWSSLVPFSLIDGLFAVAKEKNVNRFVELFLILCDENNKFIKKNFWESGFLTADLFGAVGLVHPSIYTHINRVRIKSLETSGPRAGHMVIEDDEEGNLNLVTKIDTKLLAEIVGLTLCNAV